MLEPIYEEHARLVAARVIELLRERDTITPEYVSPNQAAVFLGVSFRTLEGWRATDGEGPPFIQMGRLCRYKVVDLHAWMEARRVERVGGVK